MSVTAQLRSHLDKWLNYLLIEYKQNTIGEKGEVFNTAHSSREIKCSFMSDFFLSGFNDTIVWLKPWKRILQAQEG